MDFAHTAYLSDFEFICPAPEFIEEIKTGSKHGFTLLGSWAASARSIDLVRVSPEPMTIERTIELGAEVRKRRWQCSGGSIVSDVDGPFQDYDAPKVQYVELFDSFESAEGVEEHFAAGLVGMDASGDWVLRGVFESGLIEHTTDVEGFPVATLTFSWSDEVSPANQTGATGLLWTSRSRGVAFSQFTGDLDDDGRLTIADARRCAALMGTNIGDVGYSPQADFDLSGSNDADDVGYFGGFFLPSVCVADVSLDGQLTVDDLILFVNAFSDEAADADITSVGTGGMPDLIVSVDDLIAFVNAFSTGC